LGKALRHGKRYIVQFLGMQHFHTGAQPPGAGNSQCY
jgi:hypothetical protein